MITGYNTDIEFEGVVYHVQTEDKGLDSPIILSLVYREGAILASKRTPYDDLVASGFDQAILARRLQRQHKLICAAVHAGRLDELKRMAEREPEKIRKGKPVPESPPATAPAPETKAESETAHEAPRFSVSEPEAHESLSVALLDEQQLRSGESTSLRIHVTGSLNGKSGPIADARVTLKILGTNFRPQSTTTSSDRDGLALIVAQMPRFTSGRGAILIRAEVEGEVAELRRIILPSQV